MKPEEIVPTLETCRALKEAGFEQATAFVWLSYGTPFPKKKDEPSYVVLNSIQMTGRHFVLCAAPTLEEILRLMPPDPACPHCRGEGETYRPVKVECGCIDPQDYLERWTAQAAAEAWLLVQNPDADLGDSPIYKDAEPADTSA